MKKPVPVPIFARNKLQQESIIFSGFPPAREWQRKVI